MAESTLRTFMPLGRMAVVGVEREMVKRDRVFHERLICAQIHLPTPAPPPPVMAKSALGLRGLLSVLASWSPLWWALSFLRQWHWVW